MPTFIDVTTILILVIFAWIGSKRGFIKTLTGILSIVLAVFVSNFIARSLPIVPKDTTFLILLAVTFVILSLLLSLVLKLVNLAAKLPVINTINSFLGLLCGIVFGLFAIVIASYYLLSSSTITQHQINSTYVLNFILENTSALFR